MAFEVPHRAMLLACLVSVVAALSGCSDGEPTPSTSAGSNASPTSVAPAAPTPATGTPADAGAVDAESLGPSDAAAVETDAAPEEAAHATDAQPSEEVSTRAPSPSTSWGCVEADGVCDCYDAHLTDRYAQPTCVEVYPCCVRFSVTRTDGDTLSGCDCYTDDYLSAAGLTCAAAVERIGGIAVYSEARMVPACPAG